MAMSIVRLGSPRHDHEGLRIGTVRRPPRGVRKADYATKNIYDVWFPLLAPSEALLKENFPVSDDTAWRMFKRKFLAQMRAPEAKRSLELLTALSHSSDISVGCYCEHEKYCHRSLLRELFEQLGANIRR